MMSSELRLDDFPVLMIRFTEYVSTYWRYNKVGELKPRQVFLFVSQFEACYPASNPSAVDILCPGNDKTVPGNLELAVQDRSTSLSANLPCLLSLTRFEVKALNQNIETQHVRIDS